MTSKRTHVASPGPARRIAHGLLVACCLSCLLPAHAVAAEVTPFQATVPLTGTSEGERTAAFGEALKIEAAEQVRAK